MATFKIGVFGLTNAGKSTFINQLQNSQTLLVSKMKNTTLLATTTQAIQQNENNFVFIDVPGFSEKNHTSFELITKEIRKTLSAIDILILLVRTDQNKELEFLKEKLQLLKRYTDLTKILFINKVEQSSLSLEELQTIVDNFKPQIVLEQNLLQFDLAEFWKQFSQVVLKENQYRKEVDFYDTEADDFHILEALREQIIKHFSQEIPHVVRLGIVNKSFDANKNLLKVHLSISVPKLSQKKMIIGKDGKVIKSVGIGTRKKLLEYFACSVFVELFVKTHNNKQKSQPYEFLS